MPNDADPQALPAETTPTPAAPPQQEQPLDPVTAYQRDLASLAATPVPPGYVDPHYADRPTEQDEFLSRDPDAGDIEGDTPTHEEAAPQAQQEQNAPLGEDEPILEQAAPVDDPAAALPADDPQALTLTEDGKKPPQFRVRPKEGDKLGELTLRLIRRNPDMQMEDAVAQARAELGLSSQDRDPSTPATPVAQTPDNAPALNLEQLEAERADLKRQRREAMRALDYDAMAAAEERIDALEETLIPAAREAQARSVVAENTAFQRSAAQAAELYPDASNPDSELHKRMVEIEQDLMAASDPLVNQTDKPLRIAQMAAKELSIAPKRKGPAQPPAAAPAPAQQQPRPVARVSMTAPLAAPGARTTTPPVPAVEQQIAAVASEEDYFAAKAALLGNAAR